ncbi:hypothetical protein LEP1GSC116_2764 [Leptospira interrogans serovar Icterohaemorrhagiae str. Verdun HP]|uniref:Uncharacterized protein n=6 Tax=Leptospira interrogans TaxID=173 RepID=M6ZFS7_LEPIR|nr:hypothetical protein G436_3351 [Leptospira interrogans serovar Hardjo str. Norma]EJP04838.1 hypothetical protein LEP1GSC007_2938 [Leptospira interrogans serovar Bulgarica str. Mallika]EKO96674.1 hypothetical protein LEP1GSC057_4345 [Leptospira interrogans str. Brem 329]EKP22589.1 hypothetical protein LEP1GSC117_4360 [Leptospira interrogans serovar Icterohaemorrhagiae str. Verdun LP]EKR15610.1 hypothetical protein LEP1GSC019_2393 [Leptospira interrogans serovar Pyrogenes str. 2006006960]EKR4
MEFLLHLRELSNSVNFFHVFLRVELILSLLNPIVQTHLRK